MQEREKNILKAIVEIHIRTGEPVGSRTVAKVMGYSLSPATIRNIMADLEEMGYLLQPHTSAGRVPTDAGYRYYVNNLLETKPINSVVASFDVEMRREIEKAKDVRDVLRIASRLLSKYADQVGLLFIPKMQVLSVRNVSFMKLAEKTILVVFVSESGVVQHKVVRTEEDYTQEELNRFAEVINVRFSGKSLREVREELLKEMKRDKSEYDALFSKALKISQEALKPQEEFEVHIEGTTNIFKHKEFVENMEKLKNIFKAFEEKSKIVKLINKCLKEEGTTVIIGSESGINVFSDLAVVLTPCTYQGKIFGTIGLVAPKRVDYGFVIPLVEKTSEFVKEILSG